MSKKDAKSIQEKENQKKEKIKDWKIKSNRFVAFLDILGFKDKVSRNSHDEIYSQLKTISSIKQFLEKSAKNDQIKETFNEVDISIVNFSDSIVLFSENDNEDNFKYFLVAIRYLIANAIKDGIPLKGAFAHGVISFDHENQIYFGQPIIDAYLIEEQVNYFGLVAHNSIEKYIKDNKIDLSKDSYWKILFEARTPLKSGRINHLNINWFPLLSNRKKEINKDQKELEIIEKLKEFKMTVSGAPRKYLDNTFEIMDEVNVQKFLI